MEQLLNQAIVTAAELHAGQHRKGTIQGHLLPYVVHPIAVMKLVWTWGAGAPTILMAAVLHDTLEDTDLTYEELAAEFGEPVARIVQELTHDPRVEKTEYLRQFATSSVAALVIKLADRHNNVSDYLLTNPKYARKYYQKADVLWEIMRNRLPEISQAFGEPASRAILADLERLEAALPSVS